jgi:hypothetical protein
MLACIQLAIHYNGYPERALRLVLLLDKVDRGLRANGAGTDARSHTQSELGAPVGLVDAQLGRVEPDLAAVISRAEIVIASAYAIWTGCGDAEICASSVDDHAEWSIAVRTESPPSSTLTGCSKSAPLSASLSHKANAEDKCVASPRRQSSAP